MDTQSLYRIGSPAFGGPVMMELRYRTVRIDAGLDLRTVPLVMISDLSTVEAWVDLPDSWALCREIWMRWYRAVQAIWHRLIP